LYNSSTNGLNVDSGVENSVSSSGCSSGSSSAGPGSYLNSQIGKFVSNLANHHHHHHHPADLVVNSSPPTRHTDAVVSYSSLSVSNKSYGQKSLSELSCSTCPTSGSGSSSSSNDSSTLIVYFHVKFYVTDPLLLRDPQTRHLYYLQLRKNYLTLNLRMNDERYFVLASLGLIVDHGRFNSTIHTGSYFNINLYFPDWVYFSRFANAVLIQRNSMR
jgi:hypothetical protein